MGNQLNFGSPLTNMADERPSRLSTADDAILLKGDKTVIFGTSPHDNIEIWIYKPDGTYETHIRVAAQNSAITLSTAVDNNGAIETVNLDIEKLLLATALNPGRYVMSVYFFRDEVGSMDYKKLYVSEISPSRTELKLTTNDDSIVNDIYEFIVPSVPKIFAKGLIDQVFSESLDYKIDETANISNVLNEINTQSPGTTTSITNAEAMSSFVNLFEYIKNKTYAKAIEYLKDNTTDYNIQSKELMDFYIKKALTEVLLEVEQQKQVDPRFRLVTDSSISFDPNIIPEFVPNFT